MSLETSTSSDLTPPSEHRIIAVHMPWLVLLLTTSDCHDTETNMAFKTVKEVILKTFIETVTLLRFNVGGKQGLKYIIQNSIFSIIGNLKS